MDDAPQHRGALPGSEPPGEFGGRLDHISPAQAEEIVVASHKHIRLGGKKGRENQRIPRIADGATPDSGSLDHLSPQVELLQKPADSVVAPTGPAADLRVGKNPADLFELSEGKDEFESGIVPGGDDAARSTLR